MSEEFKVIGFCVGLIVGYGFACAWFREYGNKNREKALAIQTQKSHYHFHENDRTVSVTVSQRRSKGERRQ